MDASLEGLRDVAQLLQKLAVSGLSVLHLGHSIVISFPFCYLYLYLKVLPFLFDSFHKLLGSGVHCGYFRGRDRIHCYFPWFARKEYQLTEGDVNYPIDCPLDLYLQKELTQPGSIRYVAGAVIIL